MIVLFTGGSWAQLSFYIYSVGTVAVFFYGLKRIGEVRSFDPGRKVLIRGGKGGRSEKFDICSFVRDGSSPEYGLSRLFHSVVVSLYTPRRSKDCQFRGATRGDGRGGESVGGIVDGGCRRGRGESEGGGDGLERGEGVCGSYTAHRVVHQSEFLFSSSSFISLHSPFPCLSLLRPPTWSGRSHSL